LSETDKASVRRVKNEAIGENEAKYVFYWEACALGNAEQFLTNAVKRGISEEVGISRRTGHEIVFAEYLSYYYPDDYPEEYVNRLRQSEVVSIACLDKHNAGLWKTIRDSLI